MLLSFEMKIGLPICHKTCMCVPVCQYLQVTNHVHIYIYIKLCISLLHQFFSANTGTSAVAHASNRDEKCVMRKWCRWCCFSWVASMYTYIYMCVQLHASIAGKQATYIYIYIFTSQLHASIAGEQDIYIYIYLYI